MKITRYLIILSWILATLCCDPVYDVNYTIENNTDSNIEIITSHIFTSISDTNTISSETSLIIFHDFGIGSSTEDFIEDVTSIPFDTLIISKNGVLYNKNSLSITNWNKNNPGNNSVEGNILLKIQDSDFQ